MGKPAPPQPPADTTLTPVLIYPGLTPTLKLEDGTCITEAAAIQRYMDGKHPGRNILGETVLEQALDLMWDQRIQIVSMSSASALSLECSAGI